jgi:hypothetical protein
MIEIRKIITTRETVFSELGVEANRPITRAVGMAVIRNPFAGQFVEDLRPLFEAGAMLGERLMPELAKLLHGPAVSYGKGAIVGVAGEMEHGGACVHPMLGKPMRAAIGGGKAVIGSNVKVAVLHHSTTDDAFSFALNRSSPASLFNAAQRLSAGGAIPNRRRFKRHALNRAGPQWQGEVIGPLPAATAARLSRSFARCLCLQ